MQSVRRSIRASFRQRRNTGGANDRRKIADSLNLEADHISHKRQYAKSQRPRASSEPTSPIMNATDSSVGNDVQVINIILCCWYFYQGINNVALYIIYLLFAYLFLLGFS